jgi:hypothetical protein
MSAIALLSTAWAGPDDTRDALDRMDELLQIRIEDGRLSRSDLLPALLVRAEPRYEVSEEWFTTRVLEILQARLGESGLRLCEACMAPRAWVADGAMTFQTGPIGLDEVVRLDEGARGDGMPARSAIWIDETRGGVSVRIVDLRTARVLYAQNVDPALIEDKNSQRIYTLSEELERRHRGDSITQAFVDLAVYPGQHISLDWTEQWGKRNDNLSGITLSVIDPVVGIGAVHYRRLPYFNVLVGAKGIVSVPTALVRSFDQNAGDLIDPLITGVGVVRVPFGRSNYGAVGTLSTNGTIGVGISLMNISLLPVIP